jgi:regulator of telomere elongation helicase 1
MCRSLVATRSCSFKNSGDKAGAGALTGGSNSSCGGGCNGSDEQKPEPLLDIEELAQLGRDTEVCPYYLTRDKMGTADVIFMPYNYLLDPSVRSTLGVNLEGAIIIFDEAHNLEDVACSAASFDLSAADVAACIDEVSRATAFVMEPGYSGDLGVEDLLQMKQVGAIYPLNHPLSQLPMQPPTQPATHATAHSAIYPLNHTTITITIHHH